MDGTGTSSSEGTLTSGNTSGQSASANWKLDDDDGTGHLQLNAQSRVNLMAKLGQAAGLQVPSFNSSNIPSNFAPPATTVIRDEGPSAYVLIQNMFILERETEQNWDLDIKEDVMEECSKYGRVEQCIIEKRRPGGFVYIQFSSVDAATKAIAGLNGRFFAGNMLTVSFMSAAQFMSNL
jgi:RNA-binding protein 39